VEGATVLVADVVEEAMVLVDDGEAAVVVGTEVVVDVMEEVDTCTELLVDDVLVSLSLSTESIDDSADCMIEIAYGSASPAVLYVSITSVGITNWPPVSVVTVVDAETPHPVVLPVNVVQVDVGLVTQVTS